VSTDEIELTMNSSRRLFDPDTELGSGFAGFRTSKAIGT
jgi:hypothetical protein